ncbi:hypothetical protein BDV93DRAFT_509202 [Ceratobasidium sp. AG-I]|nr:hypothetical protein BDV93DRAFT_509202 [Ceratobasidium sp. AG-I]
MEFLICGYDWPWDNIDSRPVPQSLRSLKVSSYGRTGNSLLNWAGRMPELEELDVQPYSWRSRIEDALSPLDLSPESFPSLSFLKLAFVDANLLSELRHTSIFTHLTKLAVEIFTDTQDEIVATQPITLLVAHSPGLQEFECTGRFPLLNSDIASLYPLPLRSLKLSGNYPVGPELPLSALSSLPPTLEVLDLSYYVSLKTIMLLPLRLLRLETLRVSLNPHAIPNAIEISHLSGASLEGTRAIWLSHPFNFVVRILAMTWPFMNLCFDNTVDRPGPGLQGPLIEKKVAEYSELVLQNGQLV